VFIYTFDIQNDTTIVPMYAGSVLQHVAGATTGTTQ